MDRSTAAIIGQMVEDEIERKKDDGVTKSSVAQASGIPWTTFSRKVKGDSEFKPSELLRIASILSVMPSRLMPRIFTESESEPESESESAAA